MEFNLALIKKHPYATGGVVIVGALIFFYLLSDSGNSGSSTNSSNGIDYSALASANAQIASISAGVQQQQIAANAQNQQAALAADVTNNQTAASLSATKYQTDAATAVALASIAATTTQNEDNILGQVKQASIQGDVAKAQLDTEYAENALAAGVATHTIDASTSIATQTNQLEYQLMSQQQQNQADLNKSIFEYTSKTGLANTPNRDNLNSATSILQTLATGGNPGVAATGLQTNTGSQQSGDAASASKWASVTNGITKIVTGLFG